MRRPALLAFGFFALAASLPAEVRECLPMSAACAHRTVNRDSHCSRAAQSSACASRRSKTCSKTQPARQDGACRLHATPPIALNPPPAALAAPIAVALVESSPEIELLEAGRAGWRAAPALLPRASPCSAPLSPRPPPLTV